MLTVALVLALGASHAAGPAQAGPGAASAPPAASAAPPADDLATALATFRRAREGDADATPAALAQLGALLRARPDDPLLLAYTGAATSMQARTTWLPWQKMRHAEDGLALIDRALARLAPAHDTQTHRGVPVSMETRLTAASTFLALPSMFHRTERGRRMLDEVLRHPDFDRMPAEFRETARHLAAKVAS